jgi:hypothetical protein
MVTTPLSQICKLRCVAGPGTVRLKGCLRCSRLFPSLPRRGDEIALPLQRFFEHETTQRPYHRRQRGCFAGAGLNAKLQTSAVLSVCGFGQPTTHWMCGFARSRLSMIRALRRRVGIGRSRSLLAGRHSLTRTAFSRDSSLSRPQTDLVSQRSSRYRKRLRSKHRANGLYHASINELNARIPPI